MDFLKSKWEQKYLVLSIHEKIQTVIKAMADVPNVGRYGTFVNVYLCFDLLLKYAVALVLVKYGVALVLVKYDIGQLYINRGKKLC